MPYQKPLVANNFIFRLGKLHVVFAILKVIGKYIERSGFDQIFVEANVYGPVTKGQILEGKQRNVEWKFIFPYTLHHVTFIFRRPPLLIKVLLNVSSRNPFSDLNIFSPGTDVFLLLIHKYESLCLNTNFIT